MPETITLLIFAIALSAFFSGTEVAILSTSKVKARQLVDEKRVNAKYLLRLKEMPNRALITILIGNNVMNVASSALATQLALQAFQDSAIAIVTGIMTFVILTFGEITPKTLSMKYSVRISLFVSPIIYYLMLILSPVVSVFMVISNMVNKIGPEIKHPLITERDIKYLATIGEEEGIIKHEEKEIIEKAFKLDDIPVNKIMTPLKEVFALEWDTPIKECVSKIIKEKYSRIPIYEKNLSNIRGIVHASDLIVMLHHKKENKLKHFMTPTAFLKGEEKADKALKAMRLKNVHLAVITKNERAIGIVTMEDILEELVGEIFDESDYVDSLIKEVSPDEYIVQGMTYLRTLNKTIHTKFPVKKEFVTIQKYLKEKNILVRIGAAYNLKAQGLKITITKTDGSKIDEVKIEKKKWK